MVQQQIFCLPPTLLVIFVKKGEESKALKRVDTCTIDLFFAKVCRIWKRIVRFVQRVQYCKINSGNSDFYENGTYEVLRQENISAQQ